MKEGSGADDAKANVVLTHEARIVRGFPIGSAVYLRLRDEEKPGIVTGVIIRNRGVVYIVSWPHCNGAEQNHYSVELSTEYVPSMASD